VHVHEPSLRAYLRTQFPFAPDIDDVVQESFLRLWKARMGQPIRYAKALLFKVARNAARPFVVAAGGVEVRAVGTAFSVDLGTNAVDVLVTEGKVAVAMAPAEAALIDAAQPKPEPLLVGAGHGASVSKSAPQPESESRPVSAADLQSRLAWRSLRLKFSGTPLIEPVALLNRHNRVQFTIEDPELARTRVSGIFGAVNTDAFVRLLESSFDVQSERRRPEEIVLRRKP
jgi:transmembrane sensor